MNDMFKWMPHKEQYMCERRIIRVMRNFKIEIFNFNWDRNSCYIEFQYQENTYRMEHSIQNAKEKGVVMLKNGLDCLSQLVQSLEDLFQITKRGTYKFETWISSMKQSSSEEILEFQEEFHIRYSSSRKQKDFEYNRNEEMYIAPESSLGDFEQNDFIKRPLRR